MAHETKMKIAGIFDNASSEWLKLAYVHSDAGGGSCVNGASSRIALRAAGSEPGLGLDIVAPPALKAGPGYFIAISSGETMLRVGDDGDMSSLSVVCPGFAGVSASIEALRPIRAGVLTVSDKGSRGEREDTAGPALRDMLSAIGASAERMAIAPDERDEIEARVAEWADADGLDLILTAGGTGLSPRDVTPEAVAAVGERIIPGFGELIRARSMTHTPNGCLSRGLAVSRGGTLIITLPGSERASRQCFEAIAPALRHGIGTLRGWDSECGGGR